jgi:transposase
MLAQDLEDIRDASIHYVVLCFGLALTGATIPSVASNADNLPTKERAMAKQLVSDELWARIEPLIPEQHSPGDKGGRPPVSDRKALTGIIFVLKTGIPWEYLPQEMGCGCGMTCWRRLRDWQAAGVWGRLHEIILAELNAKERIDWSVAAVDSGTIRAVGGGEETGPNSTDRGRPGSKHHIIVDGQGIPLHVALTGANTPDIKMLFPLIVNIPPVRGRPGRPRSRPDSVYADRAYDSQPARQLLQWLGIEPFLAKRRTPHGSGLGKFRWVVERAISWLHNFRRLRIRFERRDDIHEGFMKLGAGLVCLNILFW